MRDYKLVGMKDVFIFLMAVIASRYLGHQDHNSWKGFPLGEG